MQIARAAALAGAIFALLATNARAQTPAWHPAGNVEGAIKGLSAVGTDDARGVSALMQEALDRKGQP